MDDQRAKRLWERYWAIRERRRGGYSTPILWHLAFRRDRAAMLCLSDSLATDRRPGDGFSQAGLAYRAFRLGDSQAAQHLAMDAFNAGDLTRYRHWLHRAARAGDGDSARELARFETRLAHTLARRIRRGRPYRRSALR